MKRKRRNNMKLNWKKIISGVIAVSCAAGMLGGCGGNTGKTEDGRTVISIGECPDPQRKPEEYESLERRIAKFEELHPDIKVVKNSYVFDAQTYTAKAESGTLPTVYYLPLTEMDNVIRAGYAADITNEYKKRGFYDRTNDFMMNLISKDGKIYFVPTGCYDVGIVGNADLLAQAGYIKEDGTPVQPKTWEELAEMAVKIKEVTGKAGFTMPTMNNCGGWRFTPIAWSYGTEFMKRDDDGKWQATFNTPECVKALEFVKDLRWKYDVFPNNPLISLEEAAKQMGSGEAAMTFGEPGQIEQYMSCGLDPAKTVVMQIPAGDKRHVTLVGGSVNCIDKNATEDQIKAVFEWMEYNGISVELTEDKKESIKKMYADNNEHGHSPVGLKVVSPWKETNEVEKYKDEIMREYTNFTESYVKLYNDKENLEFQAEEPVDAQALYALLDTCIQEVLTNKDADCASLIKKAASDFQKNNLDNANN